MATAAQAQEIIDDLDEKVEQLKEAVQALTEASGRLPDPDTPASQPANQNHSD
jgi:hypothetical protein